MDVVGIIQELGGGLSAGLIVCLAFALYRKDQQCNAKDERYIELAVSTQKAISELTAAIREEQKP